MQVVPYQFESQEVRVVQDENGELLFVAADICAALTINNSRMAMDRLDADEKGVSSIDTTGGPQDMTVVNESGLYNLILGSRKPQAKAFKRWVTHEVLPAIRRTGQYAAPQTEPAKLGVDTDWLARSMHNAQKVIQMAAGRVGMAVVAEETPDFSHPDIAMGLAGLMFAQQRFLVEMESLESARIRALHLKERVVDLRLDDWAERFLGELNRVQVVQIMQAATRKLA
ncbi:MAG: Bro-N domain-containing protein [Burkholderiales bacterium]|nr:Bro-N domain-containing protein [Burkholderiales bacterium]